MHDTLLHGTMFFSLCLEVAPGVPTMNSMANPPQTDAQFPPKNAQKVENKTTDNRANYLQKHFFVSSIKKKKIKLKLYIVKNCQIDLFFTLDVFSVLLFEK